MTINQTWVGAVLGVLSSTVAVASDNPGSVMKRYFDDLASGNFTDLGEILSDHVIWHQPGNGSLSKTYIAKKAVFDLFSKFMEISQGTFKIDRVNSIMSNENLATATLHFSASKGSESMSMNGVDVMRVEKGHIAEVWLFSEDQNAEDQFWGK
jgi:ketosteroid isomerase-like protein